VVLSLSRTLPYDRSRVRRNPPPQIRGVRQIRLGRGGRSSVEGGQRGPERRVTTVAELGAVQPMARGGRGVVAVPGGGLAPVVAVVLKGRD
jgi:hypothetical protein